MSLRLNSPRFSTCFQYVERLIDLKHTANFRSDLHREYTNTNASENYRAFESS